MPHSKHVQDLAEGLGHAGIRVLETSGAKTKQNTFKMKTVLYTKFRALDAGSVMSAKRTEANKKNP